MDLDGIAGALPEQKPAQAEIDISAWMEQEPGTSVLSFREPDAAALFTVPKDAEIVRIRHARWPAELCQSVALLALSHVGPQGTTSPGEFYTRMCASSPRVFLRLLNAFQAAFPALRDWDAAVAEGKTS